MMKNYPILRHSLDLRRVFLRIFVDHTELNYPEGVAINYVSQLSCEPAKEASMIPKQFVLLYVVCVITLFVVNAMMG